MARMNSEGSTPESGGKAARQSQKLTEERRARKRELDRQAQRCARMKTKNHIAQLEEQIESLKAINLSGSAKTLMVQLEEQKKQNEILRSKLKAIVKLAGGEIDGSSTKAPLEQERASRQSTCESESDIDTSLAAANSNSNKNNYTNAMIIDSEAKQRATMSSGQGSGIQASEAGAEYSDNMLEEEIFMGALGAPLSAKTFKCHNFNLDHRWLGNVLSTFPSWRQTDCACAKRHHFANQILSQPSKLRLQNSPHHPVRDADIAIRAIAHGWKAVTEKYALDPLWATVRHADEGFFNHCTPAARLAITRQLILLLRYRVNPTQENLESVPPYARERPSQRLIDHPPLIDYLTWPGLREHMVFTPHRYCSEKFGVLFWESFRFKWPYEFRDAYVRNCQTGLYQYSSAFLEHAADLNNWRMSTKFLEEFPELKGDIAESDSREESPEWEEVNTDRFGDFGSVVRQQQQVESLQTEYVADDPSFLTMDWSSIQDNLLGISGA